MEKKKALGKGEQVMYMYSYYLDIIAAQGVQIGYLKERLAILERRQGLAAGLVVKFDFNKR